MDLLHRWEHCAGEWRPKHHEGRMYWTCAACVVRYPDTDDFMHAAMRENRMGCVFDVLAEEGMHLLRDRP